MTEEPDIQVHWMKCQADNWCPLDLDLSSIDEDSAGVYIIWHGGRKPRVVRVGQGNFRERFSSHRNDPEITEYAKEGDLYVTWAELPQSDRAAVEFYLFAKLHPLVGEVSYAPETSVNLPW